ncbi:isochorismate synthase [Bacillus weihaiensis]|uniref:isochorismate synthase n=1 Tax=Bacillus weihaiensis TaxID=1547283 RepID=UPI002355D4FF|nr:isochorismate synthase [Bacillus weihaiensis]
MITTLDDTMKEHIEQALEEAKQTNQSVIVSRVKEVDAINPLHFYASGEKLFFGERFIWSTPERDFTLIGLGKELVFENNKTSERFSDIESEWKRLNKKIVSNHTQQLGTGPLLFGGFSFDPSKEKNTLWQNFPEAKFVLPTMMLTRLNHKTFITVNRMITPYDQLDDCIKHFEQTLEVSFHPIDCEKVNEFSEIEYQTSQWLKAVEKATNDIKEEKIDKVVLAREVHLKFTEEINSNNVISRLQKEQPTSFIFGLENGNQNFVGATPERLIKKVDQEVSSTCLAGSIKRGKTKKQDLVLGEQLLNDRKNLIEHTIVVKMIKEALNECCYEIISPKAPALLKTKNIQHLYTPVKGYIKKGNSLLSLVDKLHPTPALGGFPKKKAIEKIRELEPMHRGWYAAPIGWIDHEDNGEFVVAIRSGLLEGHNAALFAGCGVVAESDPKSEYLETKIKLKPMLSALGGLENEW